jgi:hypothetical protein
MRQFVENLVAVAALIAAETWFLEGYFAGKPEFEPAIALIAAVGAVLLREPIRSAFSKPSQTSSHDSSLFEEFMKILPHEPTIRLLKEQNFGDAVRKKSIDPLFDFAHVWESVEKEFLDAELEKERKALHAAACKLAQEVAGRTVPVRMEGFISVFSDRQREGGQPRPPEVLEDARVLNELASAFVPQYERFVRLCRSKLHK